MVLLNCNYFSHVLRMDTSMNVLLPQKKHEEIINTQEKFPVLYLLHGQSQDHTSWVRHSGIERYLASKNVAVIMPNLHKSFYTDMKHGDDYFTHLTQEIPEFVHKYFPLSEEPEETYVAGLSMGGYGSFKWALSCPEKFKWAASLSGAVDIGKKFCDEYHTIKDFNELDIQQREFINIFGTAKDMEYSQNDLRALAIKAEKKGTCKTKFYLCCGKDDFLYQMNVDFKSFWEEYTSLSLIFEDGEGSHSWYYWDPHLKRALDLFDLR